MNNNYKFLFLFLLSLQNIKACFVTPEDKKIVSEKNEVFMLNLKLLKREFL